MAKCPDGQIRDATTKECRDRKPPGRKPREPCPEGQIRDPTTKECRDKKTPGRKPAPPCPEGQIRDPTTKECRDKKTPGRKPAPPCPEGQIRDPTTKECRDRKTTAKVRQAPELRVPCGRVMTLKQHTGTCWFNAVIMGLFYSQGMRAVLMENMAQWEAPRDSALNRFYATVKDLILRKFLYKSDDWSESHVDMLELDAKAFAAIKPEHILSMLNKVDKEAFINRGISQKQKGGWGHGYLFNLMQLLNVTSAAYVDLLEDDGTAYKSSLYGSVFSTKYGPNPIFALDHTLYKKAVMDSNPDVLIVRIKEKKYLAKRQVPVPYAFKAKDRQTYVYNNSEYVADSLYLHNFNEDTCKHSHAIAGITCGNNRYMYNGWARDTQDSGMGKSKYRHPYPCHLIPFDWTDGYDFCINTDQCWMPKIPRVYSTRFCFHPQKGNRYVIAVKREILERGFKYDAELASKRTQLGRRKTLAYNPATKAAEDISLSYYYRLDQDTLFSPNKSKTKSK